MKAEIKDPTLSSAGILRIEWASREMPVLTLMRERDAREKRLKGVRISG